MKNLRRWALKNKALILFSLFLIFLYFRGIGDHGLIDPVEGVNASVALHMLGGGNYFVPRIGEALTSGSSMGTWWLTALSLKIFGWGEFAARFFSALSGLGMILVSALCAKIHEDDSKRKSWLAACICAGMTLNFAVSQLASSQALYACLTSFAMFGIIRSYDNKRWLIFSHLMIAFAFIIHGPSGLFMPFIAVSAYCVLCEDWELLADFFTYPAGILTNIIISGAYLSMLVIFNPYIIHFMRCQSHVYTFGGALGMLIFIFMSFAPFHGFLIQAICEILPKKYPAEKSSELFMLVYALFFAFAAIVSGDILIMAASVPALSAISGRRLDLWLNTKNLSGVRVPVILNILILIPVLYILIPFTINHFPVIRGSLMSLIPYGITSGLFLFACWYYTKTRQLTKWIRNVLAAALLCLMPLAGVFNLTAEIYSVRDIGLKLRDLVKGSDIVIQYGVNYPSVYFYSLRNSKIINAKLTPGTQEKNFAAKKTIITEIWNKNERIFLIVPEKMRISGVLPKNIFHITESDGTLLLSNK